MQASAQPFPPFDPSKPHQAKPRLRPVRGFPANARNEKGEPVQMLGLADATQISDKVCLMVPAVQLVLPLMDGSRDLDEIIAQVGKGLNRQIMEQIVAQLDDAGLIEGPTFEGIFAKMREQFDASETLPPASTAAFVDALVAEGQQQGKLGQDAGDVEKDAFGARRVREVFDQFIAEALKEAKDPAYDTLPKMIVAPHLDYGRGWMNYGAIFGRLRVVDRPDRVVILGTNHFGRSSGVVACDKGYQTVLGTCAADTALLDSLKAALGRENAAKLMEHRFDHEREHSIELQIPWIQHVFGQSEGGNGAFPKVLGILVHDPAMNNGESYDGNGLALQPFVEALKKAIGQQAGKTLVICSADLSHVGPAFGDQTPLGGEEEPAVSARNKVFQHDNELLNHFSTNRVPELIAAMAWQQNPTRWCSTGNLVAGLSVIEPKDIRVLSYSAAMDPQGMSMVTSIAAAAF
jgi:AmmeMemoRadiSam system protein B